MKFKIRPLLLVLSAILAAFLVVVLIFNQANLLRRELGLNIRDCIAVEDTLARRQLRYDSIEVSQNEYLKDMDHYYQAYDLYDSNSLVGTLILKNNQKELVALLDPDNELLFGMISSAIDPNLHIGKE